MPSRASAADRSSARWSSCHLHNAEVWLGRPPWPPTSQVWLSMILLTAHPTHLPVTTRWPQDLQRHLNAITIDIAPTYTKKAADRKDIRLVSPSGQFTIPAAFCTYQVNQQYIAGGGGHLRQGVKVKVSAAVKYQVLLRSRSVLLI